MRINVKVISLAGIGCDIAKALQHVIQEEIYEYCCKTTPDAVLHPADFSSLVL